MDMKVIVFIPIVAVAYFVTDTVPAVFQGVDKMSLAEKLQAPENV